jgi:hypothetical protein
MTFEGWLEDQVFYWNKLDKEDLEIAFKAGFNACRDKWGGLDYEQTCAYEKGDGE